MAFWRKRQPQPPVVSCYGKLPSTGDFIRHNATAHENTIFDNWLGASIAHAKQSMGDGFLAAYQPTLGIFIYRGDDGDGKEEPERGLVGVWAASGDSAGRHYPMLICTAYDYEQMLSVGPALPLAVWPFLRTAYELVANGRGLRAQEFVMRVAQIQPMRIDSFQAAVEPYHNWLRHQNVRALWDTAFGTSEYRHAIVRTVEATVEIFRGHERPQTSLAIRFPIGAGDAYAVCVWIDMTLRLARWQRTVLNAFWTPRHDLMLHIGPPQPATFRELITTADAEHVTDLLKPPRIDVQSARDQLGSRAQLVDNINLSLYAFLNGL
ncbi:MAG TPA: type VI secretion system-associated protein TagF [Polyangiaceae bacterium]|jgi:type VI secretion system protein ImpM|nr:type VI secretion system-associated protein TagF [Polyangiaceae bacterium]